MHNAWEIWWSPATLGNLDLALERIDAAGEIDEFERARARAMMIAYHCRWLEAPYEILAIEQEFRAPLINPRTGHASKTYVVGGKIDAIIRMPNGDVWIVEHKSCGVECDFASPYWKKLRLDPQISTYFVGARALGYDVKGAIYDVARKPSIRPYKATPEEDRKYTQPTKKDPVSRLYANQRERDETPEEFEARCLDAIRKEPDRFLVRGEIVRLEDDERDAAEDIWQQARELRESELAVRFPRNPNACEKWGSFCAWFDVCTGSASLDDTTKFRRIQTKHEELSCQPK
jgi:hypothetical protein